MNVIFALFSGFVIGGGLVGWLLSRRWAARLEEAAQNLQSSAEQQKQLTQANRDLKQKTADLQFQLNQANNELRSLR